VSFVDQSPVVEPVTGKEQNIDPTEPFGALATEPMASPLGGTQNGWVSISRIYRKLFRGTHIITLELHDYSIHEVGETFLVVGRERGCYMNNAIALGLAMRSSRWFRRVYGRWRQYHHHGSIDDANLLARLQDLFGDRAAES